MALPFSSAVAFGFSAIVLLGQVGTRDSQLQAAASLGRPKECGRGHDERGPGLWETARQPRLPRYCDLLAMALTRLPTSPSSSREIASIADEILPNHAAPLVVRARASVRLRDFEAASLDFLEARRRDPRAVEEPLALVDMAVAFRITGRHPQSLEAYRVLVPRISLLPTPQLRSQVLLQAAALLMTSGESGLLESLALLTEARNLPVSKLDRDISAMLALAADRASRSDQSRAALDQVLVPGAPSLFAGRSADAFDYLVDPADRFALEAMVLERSDSKRAIELWERFLSGSKLDLYKAHARKHVEALKKAPPRILRSPMPPAQVPQATPAKR